MADIKNESMEDDRLEPQEENEEDEITAMKARVQEMEAEAAKLRDMQVQLERDANDLREDKADIDSRSVFVGNVDYGASPEEIQAHFQSCGAINRVTILLDKFTGHPKGYAYVEFSEPNFVGNALVLNESIFRGRSLKVVPKRTNVPGMARRGRGAPAGTPSSFRGGRGGAPRGGMPYAPYGGYAPPMTGYGPPRGGGGYRGGGGGFRGRGRGYAPY